MATFPNLRDNLAGAWGEEKRRVGGGVYSDRSTEIADGLRGGIVKVLAFLP